MRTLIAVFGAAVLAFPAGAQLLRLGGVQPGIPQTPSRSRAQTINRMANQQPVYAVPFRGYSGGGYLGHGAPGVGHHVPGGFIPGHEYGGRHGGYVGSGGVSINAAVNTGKFKLGVHAGTPSMRKHEGYYKRYPYYRRYPYYPIYYGYGWSRGYPVTNTYYYRDPSLTTAQPAPLVQQQADEDPPTPIEYAMYYFSIGNDSSALESVREHLDEHEYDAEAMRLMGLILIDGGQVLDGASVLRMAYRQDPTMASRPIDSALYGNGRMRLRESVNDVVAFANREDSATGWLAVAVLMQGEGRSELAGKMVLRARDQELDEPIDRAFSQALGLPPARN